MKTLLIGLLATSLLASVSLNIAFITGLVSIKKEAYALEAIQAKCTKDGACFIHLYEKKPEVVSTASGISQKLRNAEIVIHRGIDDNQN